MVELRNIAVFRSLCSFKIHLPPQIFSLLPELHVVKSKLKICSKLSELNFLPHKCLLPDVILNEGVNKLTRKNILTKISFDCLRDVSVSFVLPSSYGELLVVCAFQVILHVSIL